MPHEEEVGLGGGDVGGEGGVVRAVELELCGPGGCGLSHGESG